MAGIDAFKERVEQNIRNAEEQQDEEALKKWTRLLEKAEDGLGVRIEQIFLPEGDYRLELDSLPPRNVPFSIAPRDRLSLTMERRGESVSPVERRDALEYRSCEDVKARIERLEAASGSVEQVPAPTR